MDCSFRMADAARRIDASFVVPDVFGKSSRHNAARNVRLPKMSAVVHLLLTFRPAFG